MVQAPEKERQLDREIAKIDRADLVYDDHGVWIVDLGFKGKSWGQGIGGYMISGYDHETGRQVGTRYGMEFVVRLMQAAGVGCFRDLIGKTLYVLREHSMIVGIEPLETEHGERFIFKDVGTDPTDPYAFPWEALRRLRYARDCAEKAIQACEGFTHELETSIDTLRAAREGVEGAGT